MRQRGAARSPMSGASLPATAANGSRFPSFNPVREAGARMDKHLFTAGVPLEHVRY